MPSSILLPGAEGILEKYDLREPPEWAVAANFQSRIAYAAAHVVCDELGNIDWEETLAYRRYLWSLGFGVAEAMDTAQRGMGLCWEDAKELIRRSAAERTGEIASGANTDQLAYSSARSLKAIINAYAEQCEFIESVGSGVILMASRALVKTANGPQDYIEAYGAILSRVSQPVILHWLGEMFDPALAGYWGSRDIDAAMQTCLQIIHEHQSKINGIKVSLLNPAREVEMRRKLPEVVRMYTGDDFNYPELIEGDGEGFSHALLGIFDAIAPAASAALHALDCGDRRKFRAILGPTVPLSRHIFQTPTYAYKTGVVFLAYLNGRQSHFRMLDGAETARSRDHLSRLFVLADEAGLLCDPDLAVKRMRAMLDG